MVERIGREITPVGIRIAYHAQNLGGAQQNNLKFKVLICELNNRVTGQGNASKYIKEHLFANLDGPGSFGTDSLTMRPCEKATHPMNTTVFKVLSLKTFEVGKPFDEGPDASVVAGAYYVPIKGDKIRFTDDSIVNPQPGDTQMSRNICCVVWAADYRPRAGPGIHANIDFEVNATCYYKDF